MTAKYYSTRYIPRSINNYTYLTQASEYTSLSSFGWFNIYKVHYRIIQVDIANNAGTQYLKDTHDTKHEFVLKQKINGEHRRCIPIKIEKK
jgi:hypothetical protein